MNRKLQSSGNEAVIFTPDQRLRVFVSSTLQELLAERKAVRSAIETLGLSPVMFEQGARPYPPRTLYRTYLAQSHIFVGIYWQQYGWVAPDEAVSGLEDEYLLSDDLPKLVYVKKAANRDTRLGELLARIRDDDHVSYKPFATARELRVLLKNDLALLLSEQFASRSLQAAAPPSLGSKNVLPWPATPIIGRERDCRLLLELVLRDDVRLVTLTGTGGIGKTRLALALAHHLKDDFADGVFFVALAAISDPVLVPGTVAQAIGAFEVEGRSAMDACKAALGDRKVLLILDNFEQVLGAASVVAELLVASPSLKVLVTSRATLNLSGEWDYPVPPLSLPNPDAAASLPALNAVEAVRLFVERARAVRPTFQLTEENSSDVAAITRRLDGLPLAIELAAARMRIMSPEALLARLGQRLSVLTGGYRDLPERQRTLRDTIDWSFNLLAPGERRLFSCLAVFVGSFNLEATEAICADKTCCDMSEQVESLIDKSLLTFSGDSQRFLMLETMREYAVEKLTIRGDADRLHRKHLEYFLSLAETASARIHGPDQLEWLAVVERDYTNIRAAIEWALDRGDPETVAAFGSALWYFWYVRGHSSEGLAWMERALAGAKLQPPLGTILLVASVMLGRQGQHQKSLDYVEKALPILEEMHDTDKLVLAQLAVAYGSVGLSKPDRARWALETGLGMARASGPDWLVPHFLASLARLEAGLGAYDKALDLAVQARSCQKSTGDPSIAAFALIVLATVRLLLRETDLAAHDFSESLRIARTTENPNLTASSLEGLFAVAVLRGQHRMAANLWGMAQRLRETASVPLLPLENRIYSPLVVDAQTNLGEAAFLAAIGEGRVMSMERALELARAPIEP